jgi:hypothetical protein
VTLTSDNPFVISKPFLRNGQRHIPFVTVRIPSFFLHELITDYTQENTTQKTKDLEMGISRKSDSKVL